MQTTALDVSRPALRSVLFASGLALGAVWGSGGEIWIAGGNGIILRGH
jgi:hypothetical protein